MGRAGRWRARGQTLCRRPPRRCARGASSTTLACSASAAAARARTGAGSALGAPARPGRAAVAWQWARNRMPRAHTSLQQAGQPLNVELRADGLARLRRTGVLLLRGEWREAVRAIMAGRAGERPEALAARRAYLDHGDVRAALAGIHRSAVAERAILEVRAAVCARRVRSNMHCRSSALSCSASQGGCIRVSGLSIRWVCWLRASELDVPSWLTVCLSRGCGICMTVNGTICGCLLLYQPRRPGPHYILLQLPCTSMRLLARRACAAVAAQGRPRGRK